MGSGGILVTGACGQVGLPLVEALCARHGTHVVWASDKRPWQSKNAHDHKDTQFIQLDVLDERAVFECMRERRIDTVYHLASLLSAQGEQYPRQAWRIGIDGLFHVLEALRGIQNARLFFPSSIAVCGPSSPRDCLPQYGYNDPQTIYGIAKLAGEQLMAYYDAKYGLDVRSMRYPGLIGGTPGGGVTDYACDMYEAARHKKHYECFLAPDTKLPLMDINDAINGAIQLMETPKENLSVRTSYNVHAFSCTPKQLQTAIQIQIPDFTVHYKPDHRDAIARSWPQSIDDANARQEWGWKPQMDLKALTHKMLNTQYVE